MLKLTSVMLSFEMQSIKYKYMNLPKFPHSAMFVSVTACGKTEFLLKLLETVYKNHFEFIVILCPTILDNKTYLSRKWIFDYKNVFIVCDVKGKLNELMDKIS